MGLCNLSFADTKPAPSYNEVFAQQLKCNSSYFSNSPWDKKNPVLAKMDKSTIVLISKPIITELSQKIIKSNNPDYNNTKDRSFKVSSTHFSTFVCGTNKPIEQNKIQGKPVEALIVINETKSGSGSYRMAAGEPGDIPGSDPKLYSNFLYYAADDDNKGGMFCVVLIEDFLKNSSAINIEKLCQGKSAKDREATKNAIEQARKALAAAGVEKTK